MKDFEQILEELKIPEVETKTHQRLLKKHLLNNFETNPRSIFLRGGELSIMYLKSKGIFGKFAIGALVLLLAVAVATGFNPMKLQKANAQDIVKKALDKVSRLPQSEQEKLENEREVLQKAQKAKDLHIESSSKTQTGTNVTVLKFTDDEGHEETVEIDDDDLPIVANPSTTPSPSPSTTVTPSAGAGSNPSTSPSPTSANKSIRGGEREDERHEDVKGINIQSSTEVKSDDSKTSVSTQNSVSGSKETENEKKD